MIKSLAHIVRSNLLTALAIGITLLMVVPTGISYAQWYGPGDSRNSECSGSLSCTGTGDSYSNEGSVCYGPANACGTRNQGIVVSGQCMKQTYTGTNGKGQAQYSYSPISPPANPANYGAACQSAANACGVRNTGTIQCNGTCSAAAAPALPAGYGTSCQSSANACGQRSTGTIQCNGACSVSAAPANPANYGTSCSSPANACGEIATGTIQCNGQCSVSTTQAPALPTGYGNSCQSAANSCGMRNTGVIQCSGQCSASAPSENLCAIDATINIEAAPALVQRGSTTNITWSTTDATSCTVVGTNGDNWSGLTGNRTSGAISDKTTYSISCVGVNTEIVTGSVIVNIVPVFQEF